MSPGQSTFTCAPSASPYSGWSLLDSPAWVDDAGLGAQGSNVTYGTSSTTEGKLSVPERLYSSLEAREQTYSEDSWATALAFPVPFADGISTARTSSRL